MQLGVTVLGGRIRANPLGSEIAIARDIQINDAGEKHALYKNKPTLFDAFVCTVMKCSIQGMR